VGSGDPVLHGGDRLVLHCHGEGGVGQEAGQGAFGGGEPGLGRRDGGGGLFAGGVVHGSGVGLDVGEVVGQGVDPEVLGGVLERVLDPPPGLQRPQQRDRARGDIRGQDLHRHGAVLEPGDLPGGAVPGDGDGFVRVDQRPDAGLPGLAVWGRGGGDQGQAGRGGQGCAAVGHPIRAGVPARGEGGRVGPAPVEAEQDPRVGPGHRPQLHQRRGQGLGQAGRLPRGEDQGPAPGIDHERVGPAPGDPPMLGVPALAHRFRARVGDEVVVDVVDARGLGVGGQQRGR